MKKYIAFFRIRFSTLLQYRTAALSGIITQFSFGFIQLLAFLAFYRSDPAAFPMEFSQTVSYIWMQQAFLMFFFTWFMDNEVITAIESGAIAYELVRPMDLYKRWFCQNLAHRLSSGVLRCFPILIIATLIPPPLRMTFPADGTQFLMFLLSMPLSMCVVIAFTIIICIMVFYTLSSTGLRFAVGMMADFLAGGIVPLPFFPNGIRQVAEALPFAAMQNMPLRIYSGDIAGVAAVRGLAFQFFWLVVLILIGRGLMTRALKRVVVQGG